VACRDENQSTPEHVLAETIQEETPRQRAERLVGNLSGLFREEIKAKGGADAVIKWLRDSDD
jgi:bisphosphoglycerate-dependent phosphoglycerate mutase